MSDNASAKIRVTVSDGCTVIALEGEIDLSNADEVHATIDRLNARPSPRVVFDLARLDYLDSSGIALLLAAAEQSDVEITHASDLITRLLDITGVSEVVRVVP